MKIMVLSFTNPKSDPRVNRQIRMLKSDYQIIVAGEGNANIDHVEFIEIEKEKKKFVNGKIVSGLFLFLRSYKRFYWSFAKVRNTYKKLKDIYFDIIIANDIETLPLALELANNNGAKVIFDAHEYYPRQFENNFKWKVLFQGYYAYLCKKYMKQSDAVFTVCEGLRSEYKKEFGIESKILTNAPDFENLKPSKVSEKIRIIHHGIANKSRKIENMIEIMDYLDDRFELDLMLVKKNPEYYNFIQKIASKRKNVKVIEPVEMRDIATFINKYDIGLFLLEPINFNYQNALPNKFFEFIQARLMIAIGPSEQMAKIVNEYKCGVVSVDFTPRSLALKLNSLDKSDIELYKKNSDDVAEILSSLSNEEILKSTIRNI
ncbi:group 1 glycosyl transferase [Bacillus freudenreichii]|nr:group 1 glycosyl transferase [Bacillus freudenreichii]